MMRAAKGFVSQLRIALIRLPLNLRSNRWYVVLGKRLYVHSPRESRTFGTLATQSSLASGSQRHGVYRRIAISRLRKVDTAWSNDAILVPNLGRFGNAVREVVSALSVARSIGVGHVYLAGDNVFAAGSEVPSRGIQVLETGPTLWIDQEPPTRPPFSRLIRWSRHHYRLSDNRDEEWGFLRDALGLEESHGDPDSVTIHLRGGDVFGSRDVRNYGQPPLSFYEKVLEHCNPPSVHIVYQDDRNPVLEPLEELCKRLGITSTRQSGALKDDIETLLAAHTLIAGRGTFLPAVAGLSKILRRVYFFEDKFLIQPPRSGLDIYRVSDREGEFVETVLRGNWENRPDQRELMLSYPASHLTLERLSET